MDETLTKPHYLGHRERLRNRLMDSPKDTLPDYEIVELLLCLTKPQSDVKPLAKLLLQEFTTISKLLYAEPEQLRRIKGVGEGVIASFKLFQEVIERSFKIPLMEKPIIQSWQSLLDYCRISMGHMLNEHFRVLYLNSKNRIIEDVLFDSGTVNNVAVYPREIIRKALEKGASSLVLVHNHPSGDPTPSQEDIFMTKKIIAAGQPFNITVHDHVIITAHSHYSMKSHHLI